MSIYNRFKAAIEKANRIIISTHIHPDADGIGSEIALCFALNQIGKSAICVNEEPLLERYKYMDPEDYVIGYEQYIEKHPDEQIDLFIVADTNSLNRIGPKVGALGSESKDILFIDHHPCPKEIMAIHCVDTTMAATGEIVGYLIESIGVGFTKEIALPLYTSILIDTSSFRYPTVSASTHELISKLMRSGIKSAYAYNQIYGTKDTDYLRLLGNVLSGTGSTKDEKIVWFTITEEILEKYHIDPEDTHGFINHLLILGQTEVGIMFRQMKNNVKVSFRSIGSVNVGLLAQSLGGGGHEHSSATIIKGEINEVIKHTIDKVSRMISDD